MKLVFLTVSLVAAFTVEPGPDSQHSIIAEQSEWPNSTPGPHNSEETILIAPKQPHGPGFALGPDDSEEPGPDSQHSIIAEQPEWPNSTPGPHNSEESISITPKQPQGPGFDLGLEQSDESSIIAEPQLFDLQEENGESESELRGSSCKAKLDCSIRNGSCVASGARCYGRRVPAGCKGSCDCCIPGCSEELGFFRPTGSYQCFKLFTDKGRNWTDANAKCRAEGLDPPHPYDPVTLRSYLIIRYGYYRPVWLYARGTGSYFYWQDNRQLMQDYRYNPLFYPNQPSNKSSSYCLMLYAYETIWKGYPTKPYYGVPCRYGYYTLCELKL